ncbi:hypothetical protein B566_EDAN015888 [Ephemera danica]|nr:hypothetical protein B566_EDAN015888 [Ephemera danica]
MVSETNKVAVFMLLCSTMELFLLEESDGFSILHRDAFWQLLQTGVTHMDQATRKQARYLLKRAIGAAVKRRAMIEVSSFTWDHSSSLEVWDKFFLVIESLEEKQVHLIKPVLPIMESLFGLLSMKWALCSLNQVINHDNNFIVKWGISFFLQLPPCEDTKTFTILKLLPVLNNSVIYQSDHYNLSDISISLNKFFHDIAVSQDGEFFRRLLISMSEISWAPLPLYHVTQALASLPAVPAWGQTDLLILRKFLVDAMACQNVFLRATAQSMLLRTLISLTDIPNCDLTTIADVLSLFSKSESLHRGLKDWNVAAEWLKNTIIPYPFLSQNIQHNNLTSSAVARMLVLLCDADLVDEEYLKGLMTQIMPQLDDCETRLYLCHEKVDDGLEFFVSFIEESGWTDDGTIVSLVLSKVASMTGDIVTYLHSRLISPLSIHQYHSIQLYARIMQVLGNNLLVNSEQTRKLLVMAVSLSHDGDPSLAMQKYLAALVMDKISSCICNDLSSSNTCSELKEILEAYVVKAVDSDTLNLTGARPEGVDMTRDLQSLWGRVASGQLRARWSTVSNVLSFSTLSLPASQVLQQAIQGIELGGPEILPPVMKALGFFLHKEEDVESIVASCYSLSFEHRKTELFWLSIEQFITMALNHNMLQRKDLTGQLMQVVDKLHEHSQLVSGLFNLVTLQVTSTPLGYNSEVLSHILALGVLFGPVTKKEQKIMFETCAYIESLGDEVPANSLIKSQLKTNVDVRATCISSLIAKTTPTSVVQSVTREILALEVSRTSKKSRYFAHSQMHCSRMRAIQIILTLQPLLCEEMYGDVLRWTCESLVEESHQPSVRYLLEWLTARLLWVCPSLEQEFLDIMGQASERRQGSIASFISVLYLWVLCCAETAVADLPRLIELTVKLVLPWTMAQHYNIRLYAQVALLKLWEVGLSKDLKEFTERLQPLRTALETSLKQGSAVKNAIRLQDDFFFGVFHPLQHFSLETIYHEIPRLSNVSKEEWIESTVFPITESEIPFNNADDTLKMCEVATWVIKSTGGGLGAVEDEGGVGVVQRKVVPWRDMQLGEGREQRRQDNQSGLLVVASLVDRAPNLGGLSRTCEVLAASQLVLHNLRITEDPLFQSLSVSADKWMSLLEVKPHELPEYLAAMKAQGYTLVAAEQTSNSVPLQQMVFPKKSLLLLGNEKEGIPAELLPLVDICVEVPQRGVVRSLNVHVTGALFIWHYFTQHQLACTPVTNID